MSAPDHDWRETLIELVEQYDRSGWFAVMPVHIDAMRAAVAFADHARIINERLDALEVRLAKVIAGRRQ